MASAPSAISPTRCAKKHSLQLSDRLALVYVMRTSGCMGRFTSGRVERTGPGVNVYNRYGEIIEYFSGTRIRSWCVFGPDDERIEGWCEVAPEDWSKIFPRQSGICSWAPGVS
jgi:hypothetical protein